MIYQIHGKPIIMDGECGLYRRQEIGVDYAQLDIGLFAGYLNKQTPEKAIAAVSVLREEAEKQAINPPKNLGHPFLIQKPEPLPFSEVVGYIRNTERFCSDVLAALKGE